MAEQIPWDANPARPDLAIITNHGYAGVEIPLGGAPDTGGQNFYVNSLALALERLGYRVTVFARGGFPFFESEKLREGQELLSDHVRYCYVPGGGGEFIRKEDIAVALDEEVAWLDGFIRDEARARGCQPWEVYELVNTHYWDAAVMGVNLVHRWRCDVAAAEVQRLLPDLVPGDLLRRLIDDRNWIALGEGLAYHLGDALLQEAGVSAAVSPARRAASAFRRWLEASGGKGDGAEALEKAVATEAAALSPALAGITASRRLGEAVIEAAGLSESLEAAMKAVDRHVWTPHSLGVLKEENFRSKPPEVVRPLKFCERRSHEHFVCSHTRHFASTSEEIATRLHTHFGISEGANFYFPPCVDRRIFRQYEAGELEPAYRYLEERSGIPASRLRESLIVFETSRMDRTKRKDLLLDAFADVAAEVDGVYLFIGGGPEKSELFQELREKWQSDEVLRERACLLGFIPDEHLAPLFAVADVFASASEMEGFGMSAAQAAGSGAAVVLSDLIPFAVQYASEAAIIFPAGDRAALAEGLRRLLSDQAERERRGQELVKVTRLLDWDVQSERFLDHLRQAGLEVARPRQGQR